VSALRWHAEDHCPDCGGELVWVDEITAAQPWGTGWTVRVCEECGKATGESTVAGV